MGHLHCNDMAKNCLCYYGESIVWQATVYEGWSELNFENLDHTLKPMLLPNSVHNPRSFGCLFYFLFAIKNSQLWYNLEAH